LVNSYCPANAAGKETSCAVNRSSHTGRTSVIRRQAIAE
jgi:hypothetical protein